MKTTVQDVKEFMDFLAPEKSAQDWDNVGLMLGNPDVEVKKILLALDMSTAVAAQAIENRAEVIITHHPLFFSGVKRLTLTDEKNAYIYELIKNDIAVYSAHTNLDAAPGGVNDVLAEKINLAQVEVFSIEDEDTVGIGRVGVVRQPMTVAAFARKVKRALGLKSIAFADAGRPVYKVAVIGGGGSEYYRAALATGADTLVTGDVKYHVAQNALLAGINIIDGTHQGTETLVVNRLAEAFRDWCLVTGRNLSIIVAAEETVLQNA